MEQPADKINIVVKKGNRIRSYKISILKATQKQVAITKFKIVKG